MWVEDQNPRRLENVVNFEIKKKRGERKKEKVLKFIETIFRLRFFFLLHAHALREYVMNDRYLN